MTIGVDLRALQIGHQYRGIGEVVKRTLDAMFELAAKDGTRFAFYTYDNLDDPKQLLHIPKDLQYEEVSMGESPLTAKRSKQQKFAQAFRRLYGNPIVEAKACDVFLQYDYALGVPTNVKTVLIKHDIIPFIFWDQYFESPLVPFRNKAARTTLRTIFHNYTSKRILKRALKDAWRIVTVSEYTKQDLHKHFHVSLKKMTAIHLGVSATASKTKSALVRSDLPTKPYLLFIGAVDRRRRRVDDLIAAYNNLKADGHDIQLVLVGENFQYHESVPEGPVRTALEHSSYKDDILTLGYVDDTTKQALFKNAIAFVFPSVYEGFGIPVLESMLLECPVIAYKNSSIAEVGSNYALYAHDWQGIWEQTIELMNMPGEKRQQLLSEAKSHAETFSWLTTAKQLYEQLANR